MDGTLRTKILVLSDACAAGRREDRSGEALRQFLVSHGWVVLACEILPDDAGRIRDRLAQWCDDRGCEIILTTGGTGLSPRDVTPEATRAVIEKEIPGLAELMRADGVRKIRRAALSRGVAGVRNGRLIVNLPGSPRGAVESLASIYDLLPHAIDIAQGRTEHEQQERVSS